jgi:hypothetical protein
VGHGDQLRAAEVTAHDWLNSAGFDVRARRGCYWQRREGGEYRTARTDWRPIDEPPCPGKDVDPRERAIVGALRSAIEAHGPITAEHIGSAAKRILGNLKNVGESRKAE